MKADGPVYEARQSRVCALVNASFACARQPSTFSVVAPVCLRASLLALVCLAFAPVALAQTHPAIYGCPWNADSLGNLEIGRQPGRMVSYRFRATHSGTIDRVRLFLIFRAHGYYQGDGGQVLLQLQADDQSPNHHPSGHVLAASLVTDPMQQWNRMFVFDKPAPVEAGQLYHLVLSNPAPDPVANFVSVDDLYLRRRSPCMQPAVNDLDLAVIWKASAHDAWAINYGHTPIFCLRYTDGHVQGQGYMDVPGVCTISGRQKVREVFCVSGADRVVTELRVRLRRKSGSDDVVVNLATAAGAPVARGVIPATSVSHALTWVGCKFDQSGVLKTGQSYQLELSAPPGAVYETLPLQEGGVQYGFDCPEVFADGYLQSTTGDQWVSPRGGNRKDFDLQFYFVCGER